MNNYGQLDWYETELKKLRAQVTKLTKELNNLKEIHNDTDTNTRTREAAASIQR